MANERARYLRRNQTPQEQMLWHRLRWMRKQGFHFRRQAPIGPYIVDFVCHGSRLIVEVDGGQHGEDANMERDEARTEWLQCRGYRVIRFWNNDVTTDFEAVMETIYVTLEEQSMAPARSAADASAHPPRGGGG